MLFNPEWKPAKTEIKLEPWQEVLLKAADIIEKEGWCRNNYTKWGRFCAVGAINVAADGRKHPTFLPVAVQAEGKLALFVGKHVTEWNDEHAKNGKQVAATMREVAKNAV